MFYSSLAVLWRNIKILTFYMNNLCRQTDIYTNTLNMAVFSHTQKEPQSQAGFIILRMNTPMLITFVGTSTATADSLSLSRGTHVFFPDRLRRGGSGSLCMIPASAQSPHVSPEILFYIAIIHFELTCGRRVLKELN